jgi:predicted dienelactone hydrolase
MRTDASRLTRSPLAALIATLAVALALACAHCQQQAGAYKLDPGPYQVVTVQEALLYDPARDKGLAIKAYAPDAQEEFPVIIFSHGAGGSKDGYRELGEHWASHGYVCIHPTHADSLSLHEYRPGLAAMREVVRQALTDPEGWRNRPADISLIIDCFGEIEKMAPEVLGKMDHHRVGVGGHSFGAYTSQVIGGATVMLPGSGEPTSLADDRANCVLLMSPQGPGQMGLHESSWDEFGLPMMVMTGSEDRGALGQDPQWRLQPFQRAPEGDKYAVFIEGANHFSFAGRLGQLMLRLGGREVDRAQQRRILEYVKSASLAYWDAYLKGDQAALAYLASDALEAYSEGVVALDPK